MWSDGCCSQYKSKQPFANLAAGFSHDIALQWHYFGPHHGKNASDGESGVVKSKMARLMISNQVIVDSASEFAKEAATHLTILDGQSLRHIYFVKSGDIDKARQRQSNSKPIKGSRGIHAIHVPVPGTLMHTSASCFCGPCRHGTPCPSAIEPMKKLVLFTGLLFIYVGMLFRCTFSFQFVFTVLLCCYPQPLL